MKVYHKWMIHFWLIIWTMILKTKFCASTSNIISCPSKCEISTLSFNHTNLIFQPINEDTVVTSLRFLSPTKVYTIPNNLFQSYPALTQLEADSVEITSIRKDDLQNASSLQYLKLTHNQITRLDDSVFEGVFHLVELYLNFNMISLIKNSSFQGLNNLRILDLSSNRIDNIPPFTFENLCKLTKLLLDSNQIREISSNSFVGLKSLKILSVSGCPIMKIEDYAFNYTMTLSELHMNNTNMKQIGNWTFAGLIDLESLNLSDARVKTIDLDAFLDLKSLKYLDLSQNVLDDKIILDGLSSVQILNMSGNQLQLFSPKYFSTCTNLKTLILDGNLITNINESLGNENELKNLQELSLRNCKLKKLQSKAFNFAPHLTNLDLSENSINFIKNGVFDGNLVLSHLKLAQNHIRGVDDKIFVDLHQLSFLDISNNNLKHINNYLFKNQSELKYLNLSNNKLLTIYNDAFDNLGKNLEILDLSYNDLNALYMDLLKGKTKLKYLSLKGNKLQYIGDMLHGLENLFEVDFSENKFEYIDSSWFKKTKHLRKILLNWNNIDVIRKSAKFSQIRYLETLDLRDNRCIDKEFGNIATNSKIIDEIENTCNSLNGKGITGTNYWKYSTIILLVILMGIIGHYLLPDAIKRVQTYYYESSSFTFEPPRITQMTLDSLLTSTSDSGIRSNPDYLTQSEIQSFNEMDTNETII